MSKKPRYISFPGVMDLPDRLRLLDRKAFLEGSWQHYGAELQKGETYYIYKNKDSGELAAFPEYLEELL
ncbi:MAG: hypothetical protein GX650_01095 [Clostridiales bacterium]|nr:hypothetical protein [Clostridiales bacterium]